MNNNSISVSVAIRNFADNNKEIMKTLESKGYAIKINKSGKRLEGQYLAEFIKDSDAVIAGTEKYTKDILCAAKTIKVISRVGIGIDNIDLDYASLNNIRVLNTPEPPADAVAEHTMALLLSLLKNIPLYDAQTRNKIWDPLRGYMLKNKTVGVLGLGRIGRRVASLCNAFGCKVIGYDPYVSSGIANIEIKNRLDELLESSDIITVHVPLTNQTRSYISDNEINMMKDGVFILNTSRGGIINEDALHRGLLCGKIAGAGLDVFEVEPYDGKLLGLKNVVLTPHAATNALEARMNMETEAVYNMIRELETLNHI